MADLRPGIARGDPVETAIPAPMIVTDFRMLRCCNLGSAAPETLITASDPVGRVVAFGNAGRAALARRSMYIRRRMPSFFATLFVT